MAAASCLILSASLLEQPDTVDAAPAAALAPDAHPGSRSAFLGPLSPLGAPVLSFSPVESSPARAGAGERPHGRAQRPASRAGARRQLVRRPAAVRHLEQVAVRRVPAARSTSTRSPRRTVAHKVVRKVTRAARRRVPAVRAGLAAVAAWASRNAHGRYVRGGTGAGGFDCSGFTRAAYRAAGIRLPRTSGAQAARTKSVSRREARPGDLVIGPGHVGIYAGSGMMWDAGNPRVGVSKRPMYRGLRIGRVR